MCVSGVVADKVGVQEVSRVLVTRSVDEEKCLFEGEASERANVRCI